VASKRETILARAVAALAGVAGVSTRIYRSRVAPFERNEFPALVVEPLADNPDVQSHNRLTWSLTFSVSALVRSDTLETTLDPIMEDVHEQIIGDAALLAMVVDLVPEGVDWQFLEADKPLGIATMRFRATYQTAYNSITTI